MKKHKHFRKHKKDAKTIESKIPDEDLQAHPELKVETIKTRRKIRGSIQRFVKKETVERLNKQTFTNLVLAIAIILGISYTFFGIIGILGVFGLREGNVWGIFANTAILGWEQLKVTGIAMIVIGILMLWSVPYYFLNKNQQADSYLIIGAGIGILFGVIYLFIIFADILSAIVTGVSESTPIIIQTFFYLPIILAIVAIPLFRILAVRHMIVLPDVGVDVEDISYQKKHRNRHYRSYHNWREEFRGNRKKQRHYYRNRRGRRWEYREEE